jgi:hypothetical protein
VDVGGVRARRVVITAVIEVVLSRHLDDNEGKE